MSGIVINTSTNKTTVALTDAGHTVNVLTLNGVATNVQVNGGLPMPFPVAGPQGAPGAAGEKGDKGEKGDTGPQGNPTTVNGKTGASITLDKTDIGLANADNTSDADKPISTATQAALNTKQNLLAYTPEDNSLKLNTLTSPDSTHYPTTQAVANAIAAKADLVNGKVPLAQMDDALIGNVHYKGLYSFTTGIITSADSTINNSPLPAAWPGNTGWYFIVQDDGLLNSLSFKTGDWLISNGSAGWAKVDNTDAVSSVNGYTGNINLTKADIGLSNVVNIDATNPSNITANSTHRFVTDADISNWNNKQDSITAGSGISITSNTIGLGGTLSAPVSINANGKGVYLGAFSFEANGNLSSVRPDTGVQMLALFSGGFIIKNGNTGGTMLNLQGASTTIPQLSSTAASPYITVDASGNLTSANLTYDALQGKPTTLSGYGITDAYPLTGNPSGFLTSYTETDPVYTAQGVSLAGTQTISGAKTFSSPLTINNSITIGGNLSAAQWANNGIAFIINPATYTDTTSNGTVANMAVHTINTPTINASTSTTYTNAATLFVAAAPTAGIQTTITAGYAIRSGGNMLVDGILQANGGIYSGTSATSSNFIVASNNTATNTTTTQFIPSNAGATISSIYKRTCFYGNTLTVLTAGSAYGSVVFGNAPVKEAASGTHTLLANIIVRALAVTDAAATTTNTASLFIDGAATATVTGNNYALWAAAGLSRFDGGIQFAFSTKAGSPTTADVPAGQVMVYKNTTSGTVSLWVNDGGTMKNVALS